MTDPRSPSPDPAGPAGRSCQPALTREQVRRVDRIAIDRFGLPGIVLMENAARGVAETIWRERISHASVLILCGGGNNGGDGLAVARHLHNGGSTVTVGLCTDPAKYVGDAAVNWRVVRAMGIRTVDATPDWLDETIWADGFGSGPRPLVIDAIFGTGLARPPRDPFPDLAETLNRGRHTYGVPVVSIDLPSGLDCDTGCPLGPVAVRADLTVTFVAEKAGFRSAGAADYTGKVVVADIGCPVDAVEEARRPPTEGGNAP